MRDEKLHAKEWRNGAIHELQLLLCGATHSLNIPKPSLLEATPSLSYFLVGPPTSLLSYLFSERPLLSATSSLSCLLSGLVCLWPASVLSYLPCWATPSFNL
jgi:hypothetical protein